MSMSGDVDVTISLGSDCSTAMWLKEKNIKKQSYPFDWCVSNIGFVMEVIRGGLDNFDDVFFSDKTYENHYYKKIVFRHFDPKVKSNYEYYKRCAQRFFDILGSSLNVLFIQNNIDNKNIYNDFINLTATIKCCYKNLSFYIIGINRTICDCEEKIIKTCDTDDFSIYESQGKTPLYAKNFSRYPYEQAYLDYGLKCDPNTYCRRKKNFYRKTMFDE